MRSYLFFLIVLLTGSSSFAQKIPLRIAGTIKISFVNSINGQPIVLRDSTYTNPSGEAYTVSKFRYYISNVFLKDDNSKMRMSRIEQESYHLIDESKPDSWSFWFNAAPGNFSSMNFLLGVDSLRNCSGAQTGALDPLNDMFWTWNSGYVMLKLEGSSPVSTQPNNRIEYHIGGYAGANNVVRNIKLPATIRVEPGKTTEVVINCDLDQFWKDPLPISIKERAATMTPGPFAVMIADNYKDMFSVKEIINK